MPPCMCMANISPACVETGAGTDTDADAVLLGSATLVALTMYVPGVTGAVYKPLAETEPPLTRQVTPVFVGPVTVAVNCCDSPGGNSVSLGKTLMLTITGAVIVNPTAFDTE